jgi:hypothetical protein
VQPAAPVRVDARGIIGARVLITISTANALITTGAKCPSAIRLAWAITGQNHHTQRALEARVV